MVRLATNPGEIQRSAIEKFDLIAIAAVRDPMPLVSNVPTAGAHLVEISYDNVVVKT